MSSWYSFGYILPIVFVFLYRSCRVFERDEFVESPRRLRVVNGDILFCFDALIFFELRWCGFPLNDASATSSPTNGFVFIFVRGAAVFVRRIRAVSHSSTRFRAWLFSVRSTLRAWFGTWFLLYFHFFFHFFAFRVFGVLLFLRLRIALFRHLPFLPRGEELRRRAPNGQGPGDLPRSSGPFHSLGSKSFAGRERRSPNRDRGG